MGHKKLAVSNSIVSCYAWENLINLPDIADFDVVVIDLLTLPDSIKDVDWDSFLAKFNADAFGKVVLPGGQFLVIGDPRLSIPVIYRGFRGTQSILAWTGFSFEFEGDEGQNFQCNTSSNYKFAARYLKQLRRYTWAYKSSKQASSQGNGTIREGYTRLRLERTALAISRSNSSLAVELTVVLQTYRRVGHQKRWIDSSSHGSLWLLPETNETPEEALKIILSDFFGMSIEDEEPGWLGQDILPKEKELRKSLAVVKDEIKKLQDQQSELEAACAAARRPLRLIYDTGESLENVVREVLAELGGDVSKPDVKGEEDGWVKIQVGDEVRHFVLEVKGVTSDHLGEDGLKQLPGWVQKGVSEREILSKGLLIGTAARNKPLAERKSPFSDNFRKKANLSGFAVLSGVDLLKAYLHDLHGSLDRDRFWQLLWETKGIIDVHFAIMDARGADDEQTQALEAGADAI